MQFGMWSPHDTLRQGLQKPVDVLIAELGPLDRLRSS